MVIPCYNEKDRIKDCLEILKKQTVKPEIIIVDGGSRDGTLNVIKSYKKKLNINLYKETGKQRSPGNARNIGVKKATGQIIYLMDVDSKIEPDFTKKVMKEFQRHPKALMIRFNCRPYFPKSFRNVIEEAIFYKDERGDSKLVILTKKLFKKVYLDPSLGFGEDKIWFKKVIQYPITDVKTHLIQSKSGYLDFDGIAQRYTWYGRTIPIYLAKVNFRDLGVLFGSILALMIFLNIAFVGTVFLLFFGATITSLFSYFGLYPQTLGINLLYTANTVLIMFWPWLLFIALPLLRGILIGLRIFQKFGKTRPLLILPFIEVISFMFMGQGILQFILGNKKTQRSLR
jgi:glycosyltransferase involved in cell wall biosynthesis